MTYGNKSYYVNIKHPVTGERVQAVATGEKRTTERGRTEIEVRVITPKTNVGSLWIKTGDLLI